MHLRTAALCLYEVPVVDAVFLRPISEPSSTPDAVRAVLGPFFNCNKAIKAWFQDWHSIRAEIWCYLPISATCGLIQAFHTLLRWGKLAANLMPEKTSPLLLEETAFRFPGGGH